MIFLYYTYMKYLKKQSLNHLNMYKFFRLFFHENSPIIHIIYTYFFVHHT